MKDIVLKLIDKLDATKIIFSIFIVLGFMIIPTPFTLSKLMPLDTNEKMIQFIFYCLGAYTFLKIISKIYKLRFKVKRLFRFPNMTKITQKEHDCICTFYSKDLNELSDINIKLGEFYNDDIINKLVKRNIIQEYSYNTYKLTVKARKWWNAGNWLIKKFDNKN